MLSYAGLSLKNVTYLVAVLPAEWSPVHSLAQHPVKLNKSVSFIFETLGRNLQLIWDTVDLFYQCLTVFFDVVVSLERENSCLFDED